MLTDTFVLPLGRFPSRFLCNVYLRDSYNAPFPSSRKRYYTSFKWIVRRTEPNDFPGEFELGAVVVSGESARRYEEKKQARGKPASLTVNDSFFWFFWSAGILHPIPDVAPIAGPLFVKVMVVLSPCRTHPRIPIVGYHSVRPTFMSPTVLNRSHPHSSAGSDSRSDSSSFRFWSPLLSTAFSTAPRVPVSSRVQGFGSPRFTTRHSRFSLVLGMSTPM